MFPLVLYIVTFVVFFCTLEARFLVMYSVALKVNRDHSSSRLPPRIKFSQSNSKKKVLIKTSISQKLNKSLKKEGTKD
jgi:hypothetical protein